MRTKVLALAAMMAAGLSATPALADYVRLGSVEVGYRTDRDTAWSRFGGGMEGLQLTADRSNIFCRNIRVTFRDGSRDDVFSGMLREDRPVNVDLRGGVRRVERIDFTCRSDEFSGGRIYINADVGRFGDEWRRDPLWTSLWASIFGGGRGGYYDRTHDDWVSLGRVRFQGRRDRENAFAGWRGRSADRIALRAIDGDARCRRIRAEFGSGRSSDLYGGDFLPRGRAVQLDLPGRDRDLRNLTMRCRAVGDYDVTVEVLVRR